MRGFTRRRRRRIAITTAVLWLLAVEVLPNVHLAFHHDDHTHRHDGTIVHHDHAVAPDHHHDHDVDHHHHPHHHHDHEGPLRHAGELALDEIPIAHASAGIAHHALALLDPSAPIVNPIGVPLPEPWQHAAPTTVVRSAALARPNARGPPAA